MSDNLPSAACAVLVRNAQNTILNWISWHLSLGFRHIIVVDAGSTDHTSNIVRSLGESYPVEWHAPTIPSHITGDERRSLLTRYALNQLISREEWIIVLDSDEYLVPDPELPTLLSRGNNAAGIALNWCIYGNSGHRQRPRGHLLATHTHRADISLPEHGFTRLLVRSSYLTSPEHTGEPDSLDIPRGNLVTPQGHALQDSSQSPQWEGGRIQHYICPASEQPDDLPPHHRKRFDRNDIEDSIPHTLLSAARRTQNVLWQRLLEVGIHHVRRLAIQAEDAHEASIPDEDFPLPERAQRPGFSYERERLARRDHLLLNPQAAPPYAITRTVVLRTTDGSLLEADHLDSHRPLIALIQEQYPRLLCLYPDDNRDFTLGDIPTPTGMATIMTRRTHKPDLFTLPEEAGYGQTLFEAIPLLEVTPPEFLPLPLPDRRQGLSLDGFLTWVSTHPTARPLDIQRALCLLTKDDAYLLRDEVPELQDFLPL